MSRKLNKDNGLQDWLKEHQAVTSGIKHWGLSGYSSVLPRIKFGVTGQDSSPQSPTISYRRPLAVTLKRHSKTNTNDIEQMNFS